LGPGAASGGRDKLRVLAESIRGSGLPNSAIQTSAARGVVNRPPISTLREG